MGPVGKRGQRLVCKYEMASRFVGQQRCGQLAEGAAFLFDRRPLTIDDKAAALLTDESRGHLALAHQALAALSDWTHDSADAAVREVADSNALKLGKLAQPLRAALTGKTTSPGIFDVLVLLGRDESLARIADQMLEPNA